MGTDNITNLTIFTTNCAKEDRREEKSYLNGKGDGRFLWWDINHFQHFRPKSAASSSPLFVIPTLHYLFPSYLLHPLFRYLYFICI